MQISVIIPAFNEEANIRRCLECLVQQSFPSSEFEVVLVDNGSTDATIARAREFELKLNLRVISRAKGSISAVRNHGASMSSGGVLAFLDADCFAPAYWLREGVKRAVPTGVWGGHYLIPEDATWVSRIWFRYQAKAHVGVVNFLPAGDLLMHRPDFERIAGFDETVETSEDVDLCARARDAGMTVVAMAELAVVHEGSPRSLLRFYRQNRWHGKQVLRVFLLNLPSLRSLPLVGLSFCTLLLFWATVAGAVYGMVRHRWGACLLFLVLLVAPSLGLAVRKVMGSRRPQDGLQLWALYLTYFLSRAAALTRVGDLRGRTRRRAPVVAERGPV